MSTAPRFAIPPGLRDMMFASLLFAVMAALVKEVERSLPVGYAVFARSLLGLCLSFWLVRRAGLRWRGKRPWLLALRGLVGFSALWCTFQSIARIPLSDAVVLQQTQPIWTAILARVFLGEATRPRIVLATAIALAGVALVVHPTFLFGGGGAGTVDALDAVGAALALSAALLSACAYVSVRALRKTDEPIVVVFWFALMATPCALPAVVSDPQTPSVRDLLLLVAIGCAVQGAQMLMTRALHREAAGRVAAVGYLQVVYASVFGIALFGESLTALGVVGALLVIGGALLATLDRRARDMPSLTGPSAAATPRARSSRNPALGD